MEVILKSGTINLELSLADDAIIHDVLKAEANPVEVGLENPLGLPQLHQCAVSGDRVVIVVDPETPELSEVISVVWEQLNAAETADLAVTVLLPADSSGTNWKQIVDELPVHLQKQAAVQIHDPEDESQRSYLASSASGERIYLSNQLVEADLIVTIGVIGFDTLLGYRGTNSAIFPSMSDADTIKASRGFGHVELTPDDKRPLRELIDEAGWLLGTQFAVQVIPDTSGGIAQTFCGAVDKVMEVGQQYLKSHWQCSLEDQVELAIVSVPECLPQFFWKQFAGAVHAASQIVEDGGGIAVVADLPPSSGPSIEMLRRCVEPEDLLKPISLEPLHDAIEATQLIHALRHYRIYLYSNLPDDLVEELGIITLSSEDEVQRLADSTPYKAILPGANALWGQVAETAM